MPDPAPYLTPDEFRLAMAGTALGDASKATDALVAEYVQDFEETAEGYLNCAFRLRSHTITTYTDGFVYSIRLPRPFVSAITAATIDGVPVVDFTTLPFNHLGLVTVNASNLSSITYTYGLPDPPQVLLSACREYVRSELLRRNSNLSREVIAQSQDGATFRYSTPDASEGRPTGYLDVDRRLNTPGLRVLVLG